MSDNPKKTLKDFISKPGMEEIDLWISKYPEQERQSAVMSTLRVAQEEHGYLSDDIMISIAEYLNMPEIAVFEVATFYSMYQRKPVGRHCINVCTNISCKLRGSDQVVQHLEDKLNIGLGETTSDGRFTLKSVECLGACVNAPMMQVDKDYHEHLTDEKIDAILEQYA